MPSFSKNFGPGVAFGRNEFLRSTNPKPQTESYTVSKDSVPLRDFGDGSQQRILQPGTAMAKITSGPNAGKIGPFQAAGTSGTQTVTKSGTWTDVTGTYALSAGGDSVDVPVGANAATVAAAVQALDAFEDYTVSATGGPLGTSPLVFSFVGDTGDEVVPALTFDATNVVGGTIPDAAVTSSAGTAGATDGRGDTANLVGLELTFLPWTLLERDVEVSVVTNATAVQAWCKELDAAGNEIVLANGTADALRGGKRLDINFS